MNQFLLLSLLLFIAQSAPAQNKNQPTDIAVLSLKPPFILGQGAALTWNLFGGIRGEKYVRLTFDTPNNSGRLVHNTKIKARNFVATYEISFDSRRRLVRGEGLGLWFTDKKIEAGRAFGANEKFTGFVIGMFPYDKVKRRDSSYLALYSNDGNSSFDETRNGANVQKCVCGFSGDIYGKTQTVQVTANKDARTVNVSYLKGSSYTLCCESFNIVFPSEGYFGISAAGLADPTYHDVYSVSVTTTDPDPISTEPRRVSEPEKNKANQKLLDDISDFQNNLGFPIFTPKLITFNNPEIYSIFHNFETFCNETMFSLSTVMESQKIYSSIAFRLATNAPVDHKNELKQLAETISTLRSSVSFTVSLSDSSSIRGVMLDNILEINKSLTGILSSVETLLDEIRNSSNRALRTHGSPFIQKVLMVVVFLQAVFVVGFIIKENIFNFRRKRRTF